MSSNNKAITFNARAFLQDTRIDCTETGQKATKNRINVHCPFCTGSRKFHLGIHLTNAYANCWRCGPHSLLSTIKALLHVSWGEVYKIVDEYSDVSGVRVAKYDRTNRNSTIVLPGVLEPLKRIHTTYLEGRNFNPDDIINTWNIQSVGPTGMCKHRIFIPIQYRGDIVSYQCRSVVQGDNILRYITCPPDKEVIFHKSILYGLDSVISDTIVVVEGVTDAWRLGAGAVCTFGTNYMKEQVYQLSKYKYVFILFDPETAAQRQAEKLANELAFLKKCEPFILDIKSLGVDDPGTLRQSDADELMRDIMVGKFN